MIKKNKKKNEYYGLVVRMGDNVSIWAERSQYVVKYGKRSCYFGTLEHCFNDIFEERVKVKLIENQKKDMEEIIKIIEDTRKWLKSIFEEIEKPLF